MKKVNLIISCVMFASAVIFASCGESVNRMEEALEEVKPNVNCEPNLDGFITEWGVSPEYVKSREKREMIGGFVAGELKTLKYKGNEFVDSFSYEFIGPKWKLLGVTVILKDNVNMKKLIQYCDKNHTLEKITESMRVYISKGKKTLIELNDDSIGYISL